LVSHGVPAQAWEAWRALRFSLFTTQAIIDEFRTSLSSPHVRFNVQFDLDRAGGFLRALRTQAKIVPGTANVSNARCRDPADEIILAAAVDANAHVVVSGDRDLLVLGSYRGTLILTPRQFLHWLDPSTGENT
jgi:putative PIN family toxin of toxin-antitoxin system